MTRRRACSMCQGTDTQRECEQGQCYAEHVQREQDREERARHEEEMMDAYQYGTVDFDGQ